MSRWTLACTLLGCLVFSAAGLQVAGRQSATRDEVPHLGAGAAYLRGDLRLNREHPPLVKALAALFAPERRPTLDLPPPDARVSEAQWEFGRTWLYRARQSPLLLLFRARLPVVLLSLLLLPLLAAWSERLAGRAAACCAVFLAASSPLWLAHGTLVTMDAAASVALFGAAYAGWGVIHGPAGKRWLLSSALAVVVALGLAAKYSMLAGVALVGLAMVFEAGRVKRLRALVPWGAWALAGGSALGVGLAWGLPPRPDLYLDGVRMVGHNHLPGYPFYAFGRIFFGQHPLYFAGALAAKVEVPVLLLALVVLPVLLLVARPRSPNGLSDRESRGEGGSGVGQGGWMLLVPPLGHLMLMSATAPAIGVRYVLPVLPFLFLLAGAGAGLVLRNRRLRWLLLPIALVQALAFGEALHTSPLSWFNGLPCRTGQVPPCLDDSNVDWGQALPALGAFRDRRFPGQSLRVFYFGSSPLLPYLELAEEARPEETLWPRPALYAASLHLLVRAPAGSWLRRVPPVEVVGGAYAVYDLRGLGDPSATPAKKPSASD